MMDLPERYRWLDPLGAGGMGEVALVQDRLLGRRVALKQIHDPGHSGVPHIRERLRREAHVLAGLRHPRIVRILDVDTDAARPYMTMEHLEGSSLAERLRQGPLAPDEVRTVVLAMLEALEYVHAKGLLHRDLSPGNIFLDRHRGPVLIDFGLARSGASQARLTRPGAFVGAPLYASPEAIFEARYEVRSDLHSLARVAYQALVGDAYRETFGGPGCFRWDVFLPSMRSGAYHREARIHLEGLGRLGQVLLAALDPDPAARPASARAMRQALVSTRHAPAPRGSGRRPRRRGSLGIATALGLALCGFLAGRGVAEWHHGPGGAASAWVVP